MTPKPQLQISSPCQSLFVNSGADELCESACHSSACQHVYLAHIWHFKTLLSPRDLICLLNNCNNYTQH